MMTTELHSPALPRVAVMGAGAVGCYYGGMLARAGHPVTLIGRPLHVDAIRREGLLLDTRSFQERVQVEASTEAAAVHGAAVVLFCVKSTDTEASGAAIASHLAPGTLVLSLQNGVDNADRLQALLRGHTVAPAVVYVATEMAGPGHVKHHGRGELVVDAATAAHPALAGFGPAGVPLQASENVVGALWAKLVVNCAYNAISALTQQPYGVLWEGDAVQAVMRDVVAECVAVARAAGIVLPGDPWQATERIVQTMPGQFSSTAQDLARGKPTEIAHLNGHVLRRGEALGVPVPVNRALYALVRLKERRQGSGG